MKKLKLIAPYVHLITRLLLHRNFEIEKVLKRKGDKLYVKWKGYDNSFNCWINVKDLK